MINHPKMLVLHATPIMIVELKTVQTNGTFVGDSEMDGVNSELVTEMLTNKDVQNVLPRQNVVELKEKQISVDQD